MSFRATMITMSAVSTSVLVTLENAIATRDDQAGDGAPVRRSFARMRTEDLVDPFEDVDTAEVPPNAHDR